MKRNKLGRIITKIYTVIMVITFILYISYIFRPPIPIRIKKNAAIILWGGYILIIIEYIENIVLIKKNESKEKEEKRKEISTQIMGIILVLVLLILLTLIIKTRY